MLYFSNFDSVYSRNRNSRLLKNWFYFAGFGGSFFAFLNTNLFSCLKYISRYTIFCPRSSSICVMFTIVIDGFVLSEFRFFSSCAMDIYEEAAMFVVNFTLGSNYMFTFQKPKGVNFTGLMPEWPYYFIIMIIIGLIFYLILMLITFSPFFKKASNNIDTKY